MVNVSITFSVMSSEQEANKLPCGSHLIAFTSFCHTITLHRIQSQLTTYHHHINNHLPGLSKKTSGVAEFEFLLIMTIYQRRGDGFMVLINGHNQAGNYTDHSTLSAAIRCIKLVLAMWPRKTTESKTAV